MESWLIDRQIATRCIVDLGHTCVPHLALSNEAPRLARLAKLLDFKNADAWIVICSSAWIWPGMQLASLQRDDRDLSRNITRWIEDQTLGRHGELDYTADYKLIHGNTLGSPKGDGFRGGSRKMV